MLRIIFEKREVTEVVMKQLMALFLIVVFGMLPGPASGQPTGTDQTRPPQGEAPSPPKAPEAKPPRPEQMQQMVQMMQQLMETMMGGKMSPEMLQGMQDLMDRMEKLMPQMQELMKKMPAPSKEPEAPRQPKEKI
jgi:hypothetical protein